MNSYERRKLVILEKRAKQSMEAKAKRLAQRCHLQNEYDDAYMQRYGRWPRKYPRKLLHELRILLSADHEDAMMRNDGDVCTTATG